MDCVSYNERCVEFTDVNREWVLWMASVFSSTLGLPIVPNADFPWDDYRREMLVNVDGKTIFYDYAWQDERAVSVPVHATLRVNSHSDASIPFPYIMKQAEPAEIVPWGRKVGGLFFKGCRKNGKDRETYIDAFRDFHIDSGTAEYDDYMGELAGRKHCLSFPGLGDWCLRDIEILSLGGVLIRPPYRVRTPLTPWVHYVPLEGDPGSWGEQAMNAMEMPEADQRRIAEEGRALFLTKLSREGFASRARDIVPRLLSSAAMRQCGSLRFTADWVSNRIAAWHQHLGPLDRDAVSLEIGSFEGRFSIYFLDKMSKGRLVCVDPHFYDDPAEQAMGGFRADMEPAMSKFLYNTESYRNSGRLQYKRMKSREYLMEPGPMFDSIYVDGDHSAPGVIEDAVLSWPRLKVGGIMVFDDYKWMNRPKETQRPGFAIDSFLRIYADLLEVLAKDEQVFVRKKAGFIPACRPSS